MTKKFNRPGISAYKKLSLDEQQRLLRQIESAALARARRGATVTDIEHEVSAHFNIAPSVVQLVTALRSFKTKLQSKLL